MAVDKGFAGECQAARGAIPANVEKRRNVSFQAVEARPAARRDLSLRSIADRLNVAPGKGD